MDVPLEFPNTCTSAAQRCSYTVAPAPPPPPSYIAPRNLLDGSIEREGMVVVDTPAPPRAPSRPAPGSPELPSVGSVGHSAGRCKPCAFLHTKGCGNGVLCQFCHLCEPGEKKRRAKAKVASRRVRLSARQTRSE